MIPRSQRQRNKNSAREDTKIRKASLLFQFNVNISQINFQLNSKNKNPVVIFHQSFK